MPPGFTPTSTDEPSGFAFGPITPSTPGRSGRERRLGEVLHRREETGFSFGPSKQAVLMAVRLSWCETKIQRCDTPGKRLTWKLMAWRQTGRLPFLYNPTCPSGSMLIFPGFVAAAEVRCGVGQTHLHASDRQWKFANGVHL